MTAPADRVQVYKQESAALGGDAADETDYMTPLNPGEDAPEVQGIFFQPPGSTLATRDEAVYATRDAAGNLILRDSITAAEVTLDSMLNPHVISANTTIPAGHSKVIPRYIEIAAGINLEIGAGADLEIG